MPDTALGRRARRTSPALSALARLIENTGASARSSSAFGAAVVAEGSTVVPVARVTALTIMGGGSSRLFAAGGDGAGGSGFVRVRPAGFLLIDREGARYRPIRQPASLLVIPLAVVTAAAATRIVGVSLREARRRRALTAMRETHEAARTPCGTGRTD
ncbi:GerW family sporulation protein [Nocardiopsis dassonvillei]|uniref:GerW family sporulation protein n=1 Tax=Nocardiopsis dassonvillei TaxID=2014 RepID=UPI0033E3EFCC